MKSLLLFSTVAGLMLFHMEKTIVQEISEIDREIQTQGSFEFSDDQEKRDFRLMVLRDVSDARRPDTDRPELLREVVRLRLFMKRNGCFPEVVR